MAFEFRTPLWQRIGVFFNRFMGAAALKITVKIYLTASYTTLCSPLCARAVAALERGQHLLQRLNRGA